MICLLVLKNDWMEKKDSPPRREANGKLVVSSCWTEGSLLAQLSVSIWSSSRVPPTTTTHGLDSDSSQRIPVLILLYLFLFFPPFPLSTDSPNQRKLSASSRIILNLFSCDSHSLNRHESEQTPRDREGQGSLACCSPWGRKESDTGSDWTTTDPWSKISRVISVSQVEQ